MLRFECSSLISPDTLESQRDHDTLRCGLCCCQPVTVAMEHAAVGTGLSSCEHVHAVSFVQTQAQLISWSTYGTRTTSAKQQKPLATKGTSRPPEGLHYSGGARSSTCSWQLNRDSLYQNKLSQAAPKHAKQHIGFRVAPIAWRLTQMHAQVMPRCKCCLYAT